MSSSPLAALRAAVSCLIVFSLPVAAEFEDSADDYRIDPRFDVARPAGAGQAVLALSDGSRIYRFGFAVDEPVEITDGMVAEARMSDGLYAWNATFEPLLDNATRAALEASRLDPSIQAPDVSIASLSGSIRVIDGGFLVTAVKPDDDGGITPPPPPVTRVVLTDTDGIIRPSACVGGDCPNSPSFGADTIRLRENNLRIHFDDSSNSGSFPANDWRLVANESINGGDNFFSIQDATLNRDLLYLEAASQANAIYVTGNLIGFGTNMPSTELHVVDGDSPTLRLAQDGSSGFAAQAWDVVGNETSFFVRDATNGSTLPFRIQPTAPTNSLVVDPDGNVGVGILNPDAALHTRRTSGFTGEWLRFDVPDDGDPATEDRRMVLDTAGNLFVGGAITQLSSRHSKENLLAVAGDQVLSQLAELPLWTWNYLTSSDSDRHIGPVAEDFYRTFGFGSSERSLSPSDVAGVALAASQALQQEIEERDQRIEDLEARLARLEAALLAGTNELENDADAER